MAELKNNKFLVIGVLVVTLISAVLLGACGRVDNHTVNDTEISSENSQNIDVDTEEIHRDFKKANEFYLRWIESTEYIDIYDSELLLTYCPVEHDSITSIEALESEMRKYFNISTVEKFIKKLEPIEKNGVLHLKAWYMMDGGPTIKDYKLEVLSENRCILHLEANPSGNITDIYKYKVLGEYIDDRWVFSNYTPEGDVKSEGTQDEYYEYVGKYYFDDFAIHLQE